MADYRELRCQSAFSFLRGASLPEDLVAEAARQGHAELALGDRDGFSGAPRFFRAARKAGIRPLVGIELSMEDGFALYALATSGRGYQNLCRTVTRAKRRAPKGEARVSWSDLEEEGTDDVHVLAGGVEGPFPWPLAKRRPEAAAARLETLRRLFGERLWVDLQRSFVPERERQNRLLVDLAESAGLPLLATGGVRAASARERALLDVLTCIREKVPLEAAGRLLDPNAEARLRSPSEMERLFADVPEAVRNTRALAERCTFTLEHLEYRFPEPPLPPGASAQGWLRRLAFDGGRRRYGKIDARVRGQLEHELGIIARLDLAGYFLIVHDIVDFCRREGILAQGRGSAANSVVCYALGITAVDPIGMGLLFERFLSEERGEWPDIDVDLPSGDRRERVLQYVYDKYGPHGAAMTANVITYRARSAVREVGKVLGLDAGVIDRLAKSLRAHEFFDEGDTVPERLRDAGVDPSAPEVRHLVRLVDGLEGLPRHLGQHSGGMVVAAGRLDEVVPLEPARMEGRLVIQWDKEDCADLGIIKVDLLGLGMMAVLEDVIPIVREHEGVELDLATIPKDDPEVFASLQRADTIGVFQVESRAQMATLPRLRPETFYDLVVQVAIIRPGPIVGNMVHPYLNRRAGREPVVYDHPLLEPILERTLGVPLFQEQLLRMAVAVAGFAPGEAEELRRAMGFQRSTARMASMEDRLLRGMAENGITGPTAEKISKSITSFALYGFPESHAASFALLAWASAWIRHHHPAAFLAAMLNDQPLGFYSPATLVQDARRHGVTVLPVDVRRSDVLTTLERVSGRHPDAARIGTPPPHSWTPAFAGMTEDAEGTEDSGELAVRLGFQHVRGLRKRSAERIVAARRERPFASFRDFVVRTELDRDEVDRLAHAGAFSSLGLSRREALSRAALSETEPAGIFSTAPERPLAAEARLPEMSPVEATFADYETIGLTAGEHLFAHLRGDLRARGILSCAETRRLPDGAPCRTAGHVIVRQRPGTAKGFLFLTLEDETGTTNAIVTPDLFARFRALLQSTSLLVLEGPLQNVDGVVHVRARRFEALPREGIVPESHDFR